ncbi:hypothetical protein D9758_017259 [Tetrapyrgos nigripes]|uniref:Glycoside hydrolase family 76 protein n=1 Tax=Tetrapyrgos nigripes TaxID=182062 RepID=A0A8H5FG70_9AGAR|nr:hypothetical protein D9758_017259 [Tetrapyrgos nigripes]
MDFVFGYAAIHAYKAYNDEIFKRYAQDSWEYGMNYTLSNDQVAARHTPVKNFTLQVDCTGFKVTGGSFWASHKPQCCSSKWSFIWVISSLLAEVTANNTYLDAAIASSEFILNQLGNSNSLIKDSLNIGPTDTCQAGQDYPYNSGLTIEGLAILDALQPDPDRLQKLYNIISAATIADWHNKDGVIVSNAPSGYGHPQQGGDSHLIRAMNEVYHRTNDSNLQSYAEKYLSVQYNALLDFSTSEGTDIYGGQWTGPPSDQISGENQTVALSLLVNAISLTDAIQSPEPTFTTIPPGATLPASPPSSHSARTGAIIGGVIGGVILVILTGLCFLRLRRKNQRRLNAPSQYLPSFVVFPSSSQTTLGQSASSGYSRAQKGQNSNNRNQFASDRIIQPLDGKRGIREQTTLPASSADNVTQDTAPPATIVPITQPPLPSVQNRDNMTTEDLITLLNQRLQPGPHWEEEMPPEYPRTPH